MKDVWLWGILALAFLLRIAGVAYGLPLMLVGDEPPFVLAALQMIQLHTIIPALHEEAFRAVLYYPPYISYFFLPFFVVAIGIKWLVWGGSSSLFSSFLLSDLTIFFEIGRMLMVTFGVISVYLVYKIAESVYRSRAAALIAAFLLATSALHIALSMVGRHWLPVSFLFLVMLYMLTRNQWSLRRKIISSLLLIGFGAGISSASFLLTIPFVLWFFILSEASVLNVLRDKQIWSSAAASLILFILPQFLFHGAQGALAGGFSLFKEKGVETLILTPLNALLLTARTEFVLVGLFLVGLVSLWFLQKRWALFAGCFFLAYVAAFYLLFEFQPRFMLPLVPLYAIVAPAAYLAFKNNRIVRIVILILLIAPLAVSMRISYLAHANDTRTLAREWIITKALPADKIISYGNLLRLPTRAEEVAGLRAIDPAAVRKVDVADEALDNKNLPLVLNISNVRDEDFFKNLPQFAEREGYTYAVVEKGYGGKMREQALLALTDGTTEIARFEGLSSQLSITESGFTGTLADLFSDKLFGPTVVIYRLR
jgi:hypothetical protein